ncbi:MAG: ABC transporter permease, partial [Pikeienuella sp.]
FTTGADSTLPELLYAKMVSGYSPLVPTLGVMSVVGSFLIIMLALSIAWLRRANRESAPAEN